MLSQEIALDARVCKLAVASHRPYLRSLISSAAADRLGSQLIAQYCGAHDLAARVEELGETQVLLLDCTRLGGVWHAIEEVKRRKPLCAVVAMISSSSDYLPTRIQGAGVIGIVAETDSVEDIMQALAVASRGGMFVSSSVRQQSAEKLTAKLTARELAVLPLVCSGRTDAEIGETLRISALTVEGHRKNCMGKLGSPDIAALFIAGLRCGIVTIEEMNCARRERRSARPAK